MPSSRFLSRLALQPLFDAVREDGAGIQFPSARLSLTWYADSSVVFFETPAQVHAYIRRQTQFDEGTGAKLGPSAVYRLISEPERPQAETDDAAGSE